MTQVVLAGETLAVFLADGDAPLDATTRFTLTFAGAESNTAIALSRQGVPCALLGRVGSDALGRAVVRHLRGEGVDVSHLRVDESAPTGVLVRNASTVSTEVIYGRLGSAGSRLRPDDVPTAPFDGVEAFHYTGITCMLSAQAAAACMTARELARERGALISFDPNIRLRMAPIERWREALEAHLDAADIVFTGADEAIALTGAATAENAAADLRKRRRGSGDRPIVVVKDGERGARVFHGAEMSTAKALRVTAVDPVGAGDAFNGGFLAAWLSEGTVAAALENGSRLGAASVVARGDTAGLPDTAFNGGELRAAVLR